MKISIVVPVYNKQRYLHATLTQVQSQSLRDFECILIDDGSTDESGSICEDFAQSDQRFQVCHIPNGGVSHARNVGLDRVSGEYVTFIDADDELHRDYLKNLYNCMVQGRAELVIGSYQKVWDDRSQVQMITCPFGNGIWKLQDLLPRFAEVQKSTGLFGCCAAKMFPISLIKETRFDETLQLAEDFEFYLRLYAKVKTVYMDDKPYYRYRQGAENSTALTEDDKIDYFAQLRICLRYRKFLTGRNSFEGQNKRIVDKQLSRYLYYSLFYCPMTQFDERFEALFSLQRSESILPQGDGLFQKCLLMCLTHHRPFAAKQMLLTYRALRSAAKRGKKR